MKKQDHISWKKDRMLHSLDIVQTTNIDIKKEPINQLREDSVIYLVRQIRISTCIIAVYKMQAEHFVSTNLQVFHDDDDDDVIQSFNYSQIKW